MLSQLSLIFIVTDDYLGILIMLPIIISFMMITIIYQIYLRYKLE